MTADPPPGVQLARLTDGYLTSQLIFTAAGRHCRFPISLEIEAGISCSGR